MSHSIITLLLLFTVTTVYATTKTCSRSHLGQSFCQYTVGDVGTKIIISAPHGGSLKPPRMGTRDAGCFVGGKCVWSHKCRVKNYKRCAANVKKDSYTKELAEMLAKELKKLTGKHPHLIINNIHRSKLDANRGQEEATFGYNWAKTAFTEYHRFIYSAKKKITGRGLFIDMHGQDNIEGWNELGYLVTKTRLNSDKPLATYSSLKYGAKKVSVSFKSLLRGRNSLGQLLQNEGYNTIPSAANKKPGKGNYFTGGYNIRKYGSKNGGKIDGVQIETHTNYRNVCTGPRYAKALARSVKKFMDIYY